MSYAEHGSRIFLTGKFNSNPLSLNGDHVIAKRSEGRLKLFDSCSDLRAWSPNTLDNCRHFREIVENRIPSGKIIPHEVIIEYLVKLGEAELAAVRRQLNKYKSLRLTAEQEKQLREIDYCSDIHVGPSQSISLREQRIVEDDSGIPKRPGTPTQSICSSSSNFHDIEIDNGSTTDNNSDQSQEVSIFSAACEDVDSWNERTKSVDKISRNNEAFEDDDNQGIIIKKDSEIVALHHELAAKNADLEELREICKSLQSSLEVKESTIRTLRKNLKISQEQLLVMGEQLREQTEDWKQKLCDSKDLIDHLKNSLAEKSQNCNDQLQEIQDLRERINETETLRSERDSLNRKLEEVRIVLCERDDLIKVNQEQAISLSDQEDEINRLLGFIQKTLAESKERETRMKSELRELRAELGIKNSTISQFETHQVTVRTDISPTGSLSQLQTAEIEKFKLALEEDLQAVEEELSRRLDTNDRFENPEMATRLKNTRVKTKETGTHKNWTNEKDVMECSIEKLNMQASLSNERNLAEEAIVEKIFQNFEDSKETLRRLVLELEPYVDERITLIDEIKWLKEALDNAKQDSVSRDLKTQKEYLLAVVNNYKKDTEIYKKRIAALEKSLEEKIRHVDTVEMDKEIDEALAIRVKRSIERMNKLSVGLQGAGDEMAKIRNQVEFREAEIAKLRQQVDFHVSRGQGDEVNNENLKEIVRLKNEKERLLEELKNQRESLKSTEDKLQSREFKLKGSKRQWNDLTLQYKRDMEKKDKQIEGLVKENEGLHKSVLAIDDLVVESDAMKIKLDSLQDENTKLIEENSRMIKRCEDYENRLMEFTDQEIATKETFERVEFELQEKSAKDAIEIETLRGEKEILMNENDEKESKIQKLIREMEELKEKKKELSELDMVWIEISKLNDDRERLDDKVARLRYNLECNYRNNEKLEDQLKWQMRDNEILENAIKNLKDNVARLSNEKMPEETAKELLSTLPNKICEHIEKLRKQLNTSESENLSWQNEITEMREKSLKDDSIIEKLRDEIDSMKNKIAHQDKTIMNLKDANKDLQDKLNDMQIRENVFENKSQNEREQEMRCKETEILKLNHDIEMKNEELKNLDEIIQSLKNENKEISNKLKKEEEQRKTQLSDLRKKHSDRIKKINDNYNDAINKMVKQQDEFMKNATNPFDSETWLNSLTLKEMVELHKRISISSPCEMINEASKTRALNDKQNQQLQQDEKLHTDMLNTKIGHLKDSGSGYMYERRKFENVERKDNTLEKRRMNFFQQCAIKHKSDSSN